MPHTGGHDIGPTHMLVSISTFLSGLCDVPPVGAPMAKGKARPDAGLVSGRCVVANGLARVYACTRARFYKVVRPVRVHV